MSGGAEIRAAVIAAMEADAAAREADHRFYEGIQARLARIGACLDAMSQHWVNPRNGRRCTVKALVDEPELTLAFMEGTVDP